MLSKEFYDFIQEREMVRLRKATGSPFPWTEDKILQEYKFTNVRRAHDKTTRRLRELFYNSIGQIPNAENIDAPGQIDSKENILFNCAMFRYFGTWEFAEAVGWQKTWDPGHIIKTARGRLGRGQRVFTGAYIITNTGIKAPKEDVVVTVFLKDLWEYAPAIVEIAMSTGSWQKTHEALQRVKGFGGTGFMAKETLLDTFHCDFWPEAFPKDYWKWTPVGPGARRGINRLVGNDKNTRLTEEFMLDTILELTKQQKEYWPKRWGKLAPTDLQFQLCEWDKYLRVKNGEGRPRSRYTWNS